MKVDSLLFSLGAVAPIIFMVLIGYFLKQIGWMDARFAKDANRLVFRVFMPVMLFLNIYKIQDVGNMEFGYIWYVVAVLILVFLVSIPAVLAVARKKDRCGSLLQATFRSGYSLIGIPLAESLYGEQGAIAATFLSAAVIPLYNVLAVISLSVFNEGEKKTSIKRIVIDILKNPLILGIEAGLLALGIRSFLGQQGIDFRISDITPLFTILQYISNLAIPTALLVLGAQFELSAVSSLRREIIFGTVVRTVIVPVFAIGVAYFFFGNTFDKAHFATFVSVFATPVAVTTVPMAQEMGGDVTLAGQLVVWSTLVSAFSVFLAAFLLRIGGAI